MLELSYKEFKLINRLRNSEKMNEMGDDQGFHQRSGTAREPL